MACGSCWTLSAFDKLVQDIVDSAAAGTAVRRRLAVQTDWVVEMLDHAVPDIFHLVETLNLPISSSVSQF